MTERTKPLRDVAGTIRSKNAGVDHITFDIIFTDDTVYRYVKASGVLNKARVAELYGIDPDTIVICTFYDPGLAFKFTIKRRAPAGTPGEPDVFGSQMYPPLFELTVPVP